MTDSHSQATRGFNVVHQKAFLDIDLHHRRVVGWTELSIVPTDLSIKQIRLDCRQCLVQSVLINGKKTVFYHDDVLSTTSPLPDSSVYQHHQYRRKIEELTKPTLPGELYVQLPKGFKFQIQDTSNTSPSGAHRDTLISYIPFTVRIEYSISNVYTGLNFVGGENSNIKQQYWHAYTTHSPIGMSTSSWIPCIDGLWEPCSWQIEFSIPRTVNDIIKHGDVKDGDSDIDMDEDDSEEPNLDLTVVCYGVTPSEIAHPYDKSKKIVAFDIYNPISAQHVGFSVGPFIQSPVADLQDEESDSETTSSLTPSFIYTMPSRQSDMSNTCAFLYKAIEFFSREFASFPFSSLAICFVSDAMTDISLAAGLIICDEKLLFPPEAIEPIFSSTETLTIALASQWSGVNIVPREWNDLWATLGIARYMAQQFLRRLLGNNEYRFRLKKLTEEICRQDIGKPPLANPDLRFPLTEKSLEFIKLKSPAVLFILDRRMTKTDKSLGLSRVIPKLFVQAMSGDLSNSCLSTAHFIRVCERVSHNKLDSFFSQWVFGSGYPIFRVTQRFNKKRMFVEMGIRQVQSIERAAPLLNENTFVEDAMTKLEGDTTVPQEAEQIFTGPMTIRIHEADGTPYEHVVDLKESFTKLDIQYNTKYKRLKRNKKNANAANKEHVDVINVDNADDGDLNGVLLHCLGDVLQSDEEIEEWRLTEWTREEEDRMINEAFEWIRVDADFEWICKLYINQPDYMFASQLQQDRDVVAQYDAVKYFGNAKPSRLNSTVLTKTLNDRRYYYGIRVEAAKYLPSCGIEELGYIGSFHLLKSFQKMFCFEGSTIPAANDFSDFPTYFVQKAIPTSLSKVRNPSGECPIEVKNFLLDLLRYNENSSNPFTDSFYVSDLIRAIVNSLKQIDSDTTSNRRSLLHDDKNISFVKRAVGEIERYQRMDGWLPSIHNIITITALKEKEYLAREGYISAKLEELVQYTKMGNSNEVRLTALSCLLSLGALSSRPLLHYCFIASLWDPCNYVKTGFINALCNIVGVAALKGGLKSPKDSKDSGQENDKSNQQGMMIVEEARSTINARRDALARGTVMGAVELLRQSLGDNAYLKRELWASLFQYKIGISEKKALLDICSILYEPRDSYIVRLPTPRSKKLLAENLGNGKVVIKRQSNIKVPLIPAKKTTTGHSKNLSSSNSISTTNGATTIKMPKISLVSKPPEEKKHNNDLPRSTKSSKVSKSSSKSRKSEGVEPSHPSTNGKHKVTLKLKI